MKQIRVFLGRLWKGDRGQALVILTVGMTAFIGLAGVSVESGHAYYAYQELVASTNAATLAGAQVMPNTTQATTNVNTYSSISGGLNATPLLTNVSVTPTFVCSSTVTGMGIGCETSTGASGGSNALKVTQTAKVPSWFAGMFGFKTFNLSYTAMAAMHGSVGSQWNIAIVLDTTKSMSDPDSGAQCSGTQISCALKGVQALLDAQDMMPCAQNENCTASGTKFVDDVALYVFPPVTTATAPYDYCSGGSGNPTHGYYWAPTLDSGTPATNTGYTYQIVPYSNNYRTSDAATTLNSSANIVIATGYTSGCKGIQAPGGAGTYYAQAIYQAQADLVAQQAANEGSRNAMIILSDGNATACATNAYTGNKSQACNSANDIVSSATNSVNGLTTDTSTETSYAYPSVQGECGQAVQAAQAAASAGTVVFTLGYGSETSGCSSDNVYSPTISTPNGTWQAGDSPCQAIGDMASAVDNFYSDDGDGCKATSTANQQVTSLTGMFEQVINQLGSPRLIPANSN